MRGKKTDTVFLSQFISQCVEKNIIDQDGIVIQAQLEILAIDKQIQEVEKLKITRSKLLDVVATFEKKTVSHKEEVKILSFFKLQKPDICKYICDQLKDENMKMESLYFGWHPVADIIFCVKQLLEHKIISRTGDVLVKGDMFNEYVKFVFREV